MLKKFQDAAKQIGEKLNEGAKSMQKVYAGAVEEVECPECHAVVKAPKVKVFKCGSCQTSLLTPTTEEKLSTIASGTYKKAREVMAPLLYITVVVPEGKKGGEEMQVDVLVENERSNTYSVTIPQGLLPGQEFVLGVPKSKHSKPVRRVAKRLNDSSAESSDVIVPPPISTNDTVADAQAFYAKQV